MKFWLLVFGLVASGTVAAGAAYAQTPQRVVLVELFTSEGCSSCPPADALLRKLDGMRTADGALIVGLGEHVTYWNSLGWTDRFSAETYTGRQQTYGDRFRLDSVYTPQVVVNGQAQVLGSDEDAVLRAVGAVKATPLILEVKKVSVAGDRIQVSYALRGSVPADAEVWAAVTDDRATTDVKRGENGGRTLQHAAVVRSLTRVSGAKIGEAAVSLEMPAASAAEEKAGRHLIVFVQAAGLGKVFAVESRSL